MVNDRRKSPSRGADDADFESIDQQDAELAVAAVIIPPDGGWGWIVVIASFVANMIVDGIIFTAGQGFQPAWIESFPGTTEGGAAWVVSLLSGCYLLVGPIASALVNIFGCRRVCLGGTLLAFVGFLLSSFARSIGFLYLTFGIMGGIGFGFIFLPSVVIVSYYFEKRRATATGISLCGSGIGTFVFAPFIKYLLNEYPNWNQAMLIISALILNCLVCGCLYRSLQPSRIQIQSLEQKLKAMDDAEESKEEFNHQHQAGGEVPLGNGTMVETAPGSRLLPANIAFERFVSDSPQPPSQPETRHRKRTVSERPFRSVFELSAVGSRSRGTSFRIETGAPEDPLPTYRTMSREGVNVLNRPLSRQDIFYPGSVKNLPEFKSQPDMRHYIASTLSVPTLLDDAGHTPMLLTSVKETIKSTFRSMLDVSLLTNWKFLILAFSGFFTLTGFFVPFIYLPRQAQSVGHSEASSTFLVSLLGITNIIARLLCGWLSDRPQVNALMLNNVALMLAGVATILLPHFQAYWLLCLYCVVFGTGTACFASLRSVICVELLGLEKLTNAFGLLLLFMGAASLVGSPIAGMLFDATGSFKVSFYLMGILIALSGAMGMPLFICNRIEQRKRLAYEVEMAAMQEMTDMPLKNSRVHIPEIVFEADEDAEKVA